MSGFRERNAKVNRVEIRATGCRESDETGQGHHRSYKQPYSKTERAEICEAHEFQSDPRLVAGTGEKTTFW